MNIEFFTYFIMSLALAFGIVSMWVVFDLDRDDKKHNNNQRKIRKLKKA